MSEIVQKALTLWGVPDAPYRLIAARENAVYRVDAPSRPFALRLHRKGYRGDAELCSELQWMEAVSQAGITVPKPIPTRRGTLLEVIDDVQIDALTWMQGAPLGDSIAALVAQERASLFHALGVEMARLHTASDAWILPSDFTRCAWDRGALLGEAPLWDRFWDNPALSTHERAELVAFRDRANTELSSLKNTLDYGLIHADLVSANVMVYEGSLSLIDFDDGGFGFRLFDIATSLMKFADDADFEILKTALISGYTSIREIDLAQLDLFIALRACTYVGWNITRMNETDGATRNARFIDQALRLIAKTA